MNRGERVFILEDHTSVTTRLIQTAAAKHCCFCSQSCHEARILYMPLKKGKNGQDIYIIKKGKNDQDIYIIKKYIYH